ncbi:uncharacterized protein F4812DRAFT_420462 [Daldinia caldariorum]|uniref:uncharacterized protein n=1 Tax=Daldinia caldariorum TaxID=326644 RepID=UPI002007C792|nr:uncharacterized protein F4812DRAFT_420462 [Daldinia caldariorum]KAI1469817.1 hypothetical protein F4812DRAFT_420462 [Daldinia caldariorum]
MKISLLLFYKRVFVIQKQSGINKFLKAFIVLTVVWITAFLFTIFFQCGRNLWAIWGSQVEVQAYCFSNTKLILSLCITDFIADVFIISIPIPLVLRLQLSPSKKLGVCLVFLLGAGTLVASIIRFVLMAGRYLGTANFMNDSVLGTTACLYWGMIESGVGVLAACLPVINFLLKKRIWEPALRSTRSIFSSQSTQSTSASWVDETHQDFIRVQQTIYVTYDRLPDSSNRSTSANYFPSTSVTRPKLPRAVGIFKAINSSNRIGVREIIGYNVLCGDARVGYLH